MVQKNMNKENISNALTQGLLAGYGGKSQFTSVNRGSFDLKSSHLQQDDIVYHDEWTNNGGQELVKVKEELFTRVYAGGEVNSEILQSLNISDTDVTNNLKSRIAELGDKTRLFSNCKAETINNWDYEYKIIDNNNEVSVTTGKETISFKGQIVFIHVFVLSPIK